MILVITLFLQWGDNIFTHNFFSDNQIETCCGSSDFSNHCCSQSECYEEDNLIKFIFFLSTHVITIIISHQVFGNRQKYHNLSFLFLD
jgi:hypothetical protein